MIFAVLIWSFSVLQGADPALLDAAARQEAERGRFAEAESLWKQAIGIAPDFFPGQFNLGYMFVSRSQFAEARPYLESAARLQPLNFNARYLLGRVRIELADRDGGLREWRAALKLEPGHVKLLKVIAVEYGKGGYFKEGAEAAKKALSLSPGELDAHLIAIKACQDAQDPAALEVSRQAVAKFPDSARVNFEYGFQLQRAGRNAESLSHFRQAMTLDPKYEEPFYFYGGALLEEGKYEEAIRYLRAAMELKPDYVSAAVTLARALMEMEKYEQAAKELEAVIARSPKHPQPHLMLSRLYFRMGDEERAQREKELSLQLRRADNSLMEQPQPRAFPSTPPPSR